MNRVFSVGLSILLLFGSALAWSGERTYPVIGEVERYAPGLDALVGGDAVIEQLTGDTFSWSEGPVWVPDGAYVLFSDVPQNTMWKWSESGGLQEFLKPSAHDAGADGSGGTNGLVLGLDGKLLAADHGSRTVYSMDLETMQRSTVIAAFEGKRFNSPNDLVVSRVRWPGTLFFTDPPYGLKGQDESPLKELDSSGVYRLDPSGAVTLLDDTLLRPNGIGLSPDEKTLYVASSDRSNIIFRAYELDEAGNVAGEPRTFADTTKWSEAGDPGANDGFAVDTRGNLWATGPGGVFVINPEGEILGLIRTGTRVANCAFGGPEGQTLYLTSHKFLARIKTTVKGLGLP
jgi:gluconolactonase